MRSQGEIFELGSELQILRYELYLTRWYFLHLHLLEKKKYLRDIENMQFCIFSLAAVEKAFIPCYK